MIYPYAESFLILLICDNMSIYKSHGGMCMNSSPTKRFFSFLYEVLIDFFALFYIVKFILSITGIVPEKISNSTMIVEWSVYFFFVLDYLINLYKAEDKKSHIKNHIFDLLSIVPFHYAFRAFRIVRIVKILKKSRIGLIVRTSRAFLYTNHFIYVIYTTAVICVAGSIAIYKLEYGKSVFSYFDAFWFSFVTITTVGYGDFTPVSIEGKIAAMVLMLVGISFLGLLTGTISTYFIKHFRNRSPETESDKASISLKGLSSKEVEMVESYVEFLKSQRIK